MVSTVSCALFLSWAIPFNIIFRGFEVSHLNTLVVVVPCILRRFPEGVNDWAKTVDSWVYE